MPRKQQMYLPGVPAHAVPVAIIATPALFTTAITIFTSPYWPMR